MIDVIELYQMWARDDANKDENGYASYEKFNRYLKRAQIALLKDITGFISGKPSEYPIPYETQKAKDYLKRFITKFKASGSFEIPADYYLYDNSYKIGSKKETEDCESEEVVFKKGCDIPITILDGQQFKDRCGSFIKGVKPTAKNPICKIVDNKYEFEPSDIGSVVLEYIRYPKEAFIKTKKDDDFNIEIADPLTSQNSEFDEWAIEYLLYFMNDRFAVHTREKALKETNLTNKQLT